MSAPLSPSPEASASPTADAAAPGGRAQRAAMALFALTLAGFGTLACAAPSSPKVWDFQVRLDDKPIGYHRFTVQTEGNQRQVSNTARFAVKVLGLTVYRYAIDTEERWQGDCLTSMRSRTDDDGELIDMQATRAGTTYQLRNKAGTRSVDGCLTGYAYWLPDVLARQTRLLNPQSGEIDAVSLSPNGVGTIEVGGQKVSARKLRLAAPPGAFDVWVSEQGDWLGLDAKVRGGRQLSYRLATLPAWWPEGGNTAKPAAEAGARP